MQLFKKSILTGSIAFFPIVLFSQITSGMAEFIVIDSFSPQNAYDRRLTSHIGRDTIAIFENGQGAVAFIDQSNFKKTFERERDTVKYLFTASNAFSVSRGAEKKLIRYFDFIKKQSHNYIFKDGHFEKHKTFPMYEGNRLSAEKVLDYQEDRSIKRQFGGVEGYHIMYKLHSQRGEKVVEGYVTDQVVLPVAMSGPRAEKPKFMPLYLEEYMVEMPENKRIIQLLSLRQADEKSVDNEIRTYITD